MSKKKVLYIAGWGRSGSTILGNLLSSIMMNIGGTWWINRELKLWPYDSHYFKGILAALAMLAVLLLTQWMPGPAWLALGTLAGIDLNALRY